MEWYEWNYSVLWYNVSVSCSEHSDEQAAERRRSGEEAEREHARERERSVLGSPESSGWKVAWLLLTCVADRVSLETGTFVASRVILCVSLAIIVEKMLRHMKKWTDLNALLTYVPNMPNRHADVCINTSACEETSTPTDRHKHTCSPPSCNKW